MAHQRLSGRSSTCFLFSNVLLPNVLGVFFLVTGMIPGVTADPAASIYTGTASDATVRLAALELRRYVYLRTDRLISVKADEPSDGAAGIFLRVDEQLEPQAYAFDAVNREGGSRLLTIRGGSSVGVLYGAYHLAETLGVRFYLHGDVVPDRKIAFEIPDLAGTHKPLFQNRGILPFHDFPEGPDWWSRLQYRTVLSRLPKLRMNFFGLHTYPPGDKGPEPTVWIGRKKNINEDGSVRHSYSSSHYTTSRDTWGYKPARTSTYSNGAGSIFSRDVYGAPYMNGLAPWPENPEESNRLFNRFGSLLNDVFTFAERVGIRSTIGTELPLKLPESVRNRLKKDDRDPSEPGTIQHLYEGMFERIKRTHPLDYYWLWTPEDWMWNKAKSSHVHRVKRDLHLAMNARASVDAPFQLATSGWVVGPDENPMLFDELLPDDVPISNINEFVGFSKVDQSYGQMGDRSKWIIPWLEDDPAMVIPQLWVGRMRMDAHDAKTYGATGLIGIHWRTRAVGPMVAALARAGWTQSGWSRTPGSELEEANSDPDMPAYDFYRDWARHQFGKNVAKPVAKLFARLDGGPRGQDYKANLPRPSGWKNGPGGVKPDNRPWEEVKKQYDFVQTMTSLRSKIRGAGNQARFDYWLEQFRYLRAMGQLMCTYHDFKTVMEELEETEASEEKKEIAHNRALPLRKKLVDQYTDMMNYLLQSITTVGGMGNVTNWEQHNRPMMFDKPGQALRSVLGGALPEEARLPDSYTGDRHAFLPVQPGNVRPGESVSITVVTIGFDQPEGTLHWRKLGDDSFDSAPLEHVRGGVYSAGIPEEVTSSTFEYYVVLRPEEGEPLYLPATAPDLNHSAVPMPERK